MPSAPSHIQRQARVRPGVQVGVVPPQPGDLVHDSIWVGPRRPHGLLGSGFGLEGRIFGPGGAFHQIPTVPAGVDALDVPDGDEDEVGGSGDEAEGIDAGDEDKGVDVGPVGADADEAKGPVQNNKKEQDPVQTRKRQKQWTKWSEVIIPKMLGPYVTLLRETKSLRDMTVAKSRVLCKRCIHGGSLEVSTIYFDRIEKILLCTCTEPALQLLSLGLFPCAPTRPTLAVDLSMLEFVRTHSQNAAPNTTAWCETLESFLSKRQFKLTTRDTLRKRFSNALQWYATLQDLKNLTMGDFLDDMRTYVDDDNLNNQDDAGVGLMGNSNVHSQDHTDTGHESSGSQDSDNNNTEEKYDTGLNRPSEYLRERCPLCFGGSNWHQPEEIADVIVCLDACFTQKRRKSQGNTWTAPRAHPETVFVPEEDVREMEATVEEARPSRKHKPSADKLYEPGMRVPTAVLDQCHESFISADSSRVKASTQLFADTGFMGLLCCHDRVLWLVNMTSGGEKQYYALCLLKKLFEHLPMAMRVGVLYDIGCQLHRSLLKYNFLDDIMDRITFGISVFHAYGHQWPCQIIYHPRKCVGFGLTDGEGCERFWSSIKALIPSLRVSGFYTRLYAIDTKIKHWMATMERKAVAVETLDAINNNGISEDIIRAEWAAQVEQQTKPLARQSKNQADKEIHTILILQEQLDSYTQEQATYQDMLNLGEYESGWTVIEVEAHLEDLQTKIKKIFKSIQNTKGKLSIDEKANLKKLLGNKFLRTRMNALALKQQIRQRLCQRKFELNSLERSYRKTINRLKLEKHAQQQLKRKEPGIQLLVKKYNKLCEELEKQIKSKAAPKGAAVPLLIDTNKLFEIDVDDDVWQDIGLTDDNDDFDTIPGWLGNDDIRAGIKAQLELDRCIEEERRIKKERISMQE
ncbi:hypothetical protein GALMADRAFT_141567 [Galerina marginata CBS 339.88]|uniref:CxC1-like cysteine cluster associated with KDZ transposases domain-containing protein n=1 Tax=Galerina marginata (strain CBS 339.88) TaxID=685588 RepID=A0A067SUE1_GALM3|nr:hypothetical protein GALMADRAFT_141567 [Galerina marginata CBS 339.88]